MAAKHECMFCDELFETITQHMIHVMNSHDVSYRRHADLPLRPISCRGCTKPVKPGTFECGSCGLKYAPNYWDHNTPNRN